MNEKEELIKRKNELLSKSMKLSIERNKTLNQLNDIYNNNAHGSPIKLSNKCYELIREISEMKTELIIIQNKLDRLERGL